MNIVDAEVIWIKCIEFVVPALVVLALLACAAFLLLIVTNVISLVFMSLKDAVDSIAKMLAPLRGLFFRREDTGRSRTSY